MRRNSGVWQSGLLYGLLILLLLEAVTRLFIVERAFLSPYGELSRINDNLARHEGLPKVAFFGSSQTQAAIAPREMTDRMGLAPYLFVNASAAAGGPREMLYLFSHNSSLFREVEIVYINVDLWMLNRHTFMAEQYGGAAWRRSATLRDRLTFPTESATRADWLLGWLFATWDQRDTWRSALLDWVRTPWTYNPYIVYDCFGRPVAGFLTADRPLTREMLADEANEFVASQMQEFTINRAAFDDLALLVEAVRVANAEPVFLRVPASPEYNTALYNSGIDQASIWREFNSRFPEVSLLDLSNFALEELEYWWDPYHMSSHGALEFALPIIRDLQLRLAIN